MQLSCVVSVSRFMYYISVSRFMFVTFFVFTLVFCLLRLFVAIMGIDGFLNGGNLKIVWLC